jgi:uncharacterized membrane protein YidH (DUF202 family)
MLPTLPVPTDNIYKFTCLFGLALIVSAILSFVSTYTASLDRKIKYMEVVADLETKRERTKTEDGLLAMNRKLVTVTRSNETFANSALGILLGIGILLSSFGALRWYQVIQRRDDKFAELQLRKLEMEIAKLEADTKTSS